MDKIALDFIKGVFECVSDQVQLEIDQDIEFANKVDRAIAEIVVDSPIGPIWGQTFPIAYADLFFSFRIMQLLNVIFR